jgi:hypothetical protein
MDNWINPGCLQSYNAPKERRSRLLPATKICDEQQNLPLQAAESGL